MRVSRQTFIDQSAGDFDVEVGAGSAHLDLLEEAIAATRSRVFYVTVEPGDVLATSMLRRPVAALGRMAFLYTLGDNDLAVPAEYTSAPAVMAWAGVLLLPSPAKGFQRYLGAVQAALTGHRPLLLETNVEQLPEWEALWRRVKGIAA